MFNKFKEVLKFKKAVLFLYGAKDIFNSKVASSLLKYRSDDILGIIGDNDKKYYQNIYSSLNIKIPPVYKSLSSIKEKPDVFILCLMLPSGSLPSEWLKEIKLAMEQGIKIINPLHIDFTEILSKESFKTTEKNSDYVNFFFDTNNIPYTDGIYNIRIPHKINKLFSLNILNTKAKRVLTVGTDCNVGKMLTTLELNKFAKQKGLDSKFIATGQIGMLISGNGVAVDRVISDFLPAYVEELILEEKDRDIVFVEGQGSIFTPLYSAVTMGLIHGAAPDYMILTDVPGRLKLRYTDINIPHLKEAIFMYEKIAQMVNPTARVTGISLNTYNLSKKEAEILIKETETKLNLPVTDPVKFQNIEKLLPKEIYSAKNSNKRI